ncbi:MAG: PCI domain-containing protein [Promethearchaeota archaeon]
MHLNDKYNQFISIAEAILLILLICFSVVTIFELFSYEFYYQADIFKLWSLRLSIIFFILFLFLPYILSLSKNISEKAITQYNKRKFKKSFSEDIEKMEEVNILHLSNKYNVNLIYIKNFLRDQITQGNLKGDLIGDVFKIKAKMKILDTKEKNVVNFNQNIKRFIAPHSIIKFRDISRHFKLPKNFIKQKIIQLIDKGELTGFIQGSNLVRSAFSIDEIECPYCGKEIRLNEDI